MRLFIAVEISEEVESYAKKLQSEISKDYAKIRLANSFHLTLKFLGEIETPACIIEKIDAIDFKSFSLETSDIGVFADFENINVIWIGFKESKELTALHESIETSLSMFNFRKDFDFHPHLTLARVSDVNDKLKFADSIKALNPEKIIFPIKKIVLYQSILANDGPIYKLIKEFKAG